MTDEFIILKSVTELNTRVNKVSSLFLVQKNGSNEMIRSFIVVDKFFIMNCF